LNDSAVYTHLLQRLVRLRRRAVAVECLAVLLQALGLGLIGLLVWGTIEAMFYLSPWWRSGMGAGVLIGSVAFGLWRLKIGLPPLTDLRRLALRVEACHPPLQQRLISTLELWESGRGYSPTLLAATLQRAAELLDGLDEDRVADLSRAGRALRPVAAAAAVLLLGVVFPGSPLGDALYRCWHPATAFARPARTTVAVEPGDMEVIKGEDAVIKIRFTGESPLSTVVASRVGGAADWRREEIISGGNDSLSYVFKQIKRAFSYRVEAGDGVSDTFRITVIEPPALQRLRLHYDYPAYSRLPSRSVEDNGDIRALAGTRVSFELVANKALARAELVLDDSLRLSAVIDGSDATVARVEWEVGPAGQYHFALRDAKGVANRDPIRYAVQVLQDLPPRVEFTDPARDMDLPETRRIPLALEAEDDFGVDKVELVFRVNDGPERRMGLPFAPGPASTVAFLWDLRAYDLLPDDTVTYRAEAFDNDAVLGPKVGASREYILRFPSLEELYEEIEALQEASLNELEELVEEGRENREQVEDLRRELLRHQELSWEQQQELEETLEAEAERLAKMDELANQMEEAISEAERNDLASEDVLEKLQAIRELMEQIATPEMQDALADIQEAMEEMDPEQLAEALKQFTEDQDAFQERLDRTIALLEQVQAEQELEAAVRQAADLAQRQEKVNEALAQEEADARLQEQEEALASDTEALAQGLEELSQTMERIEPQAAEALAQEAEAMAKDELSQRMQEMAEKLEQARSEQSQSEQDQSESGQMQQGQMQQGQMQPGQMQQQARSQGGSIQQDLEQLAQRLQNIQQDFSEQQKEEMTQDMRQAMRQLIGLSRQQEGLGQRTRQTSPDPSVLAPEQFALLEATGLVVESVAGVAERTLSVEHGLAPTLGRALNQMDAAAGRLGQRQGGPAVDAQGQAMGYLNEAVLLLRQSIDNLSQAQMPSGFAEAMQKMMGLSQQQGQVNGQSQDALNGQKPGPGGRGPDLRRLAAQQRQIYQALEQLESGVRGRRGAEKRLESIQEEMRGVIADLDRGRLDAGVVQRQRRIEQRMLDASRSIHTRGHENKRRAERGAAPAYDGPDWLPEDLGQARDVLRQAMKAALEGSYPEAYRRSIRRYYENIYQDLIGNETEAPSE
jgi:hypothetical protein